MTRKSKKTPVVLTKRKSKPQKWSAVESINRGVKGFGIGLGKKRKNKKQKRVTY